MKNPEQRVSEAAKEARIRIVNYLMDRVKQPLARHEEEEIERVIQEFAIDASQPASAVPDKCWNCDGLNELVLRCSRCGLASAASATDGVRHSAKPETLTPQIADERTSQSDIQREGDEISYRRGDAPFFGPPEEPASDPRYIKHVRCEGARFHVLSWSTQGTHCSEPRCIINKRSGPTNPEGGSSPAASVSQKEEA